MSIRALTLLACLGLLTACSYFHQQEIIIRNNSSYDLEIWRHDTVFLYISSGQFSTETVSQKGKAKDHLGLLPFPYYLEETDSIALEGNHSLMKDLENIDNWTQYLTGSGRNKGLFMQFEFDDNDIQ